LFYFVDILTKNLLNDILFDFIYSYDEKKMKE